MPPPAQFRRRCSSIPPGAQRAAVDGPLNYNLLFRRFVGLEMDDGVWNHAVFSKNRDRLLNQDLAQKFSAHVKQQAAMYRGR